MIFQQKMNTHWGFFLLGALIGLGLWWITEFPDWADSSWLVALFMSLLCLGLALTLLWQPEQEWRSYWIVLPPLMLFAALIVWVWLQVPPSEALEVLYDGDDFRQGTVITAILLIGYVLLPYLQLWAQKTSPNAATKPFTYAHWLSLLLRNTTLVATAAAFLGLFWLLLGLWAALFELVGIEVFSDLFSTEGFIWLASSSMLALGIAIARERSQWLQTLQNHAFSLIRLLSPVLALMGAVFIAVLPFTGLQVLWDTGHASALLLTLAVFILGFINASYLDGANGDNLKPWLLRTQQLLLLLLPIFTCLALYATYLRVEQYGLMPNRLYALLMALVMSGVALGYAYIGARQYPHFRGLSKLNSAVIILIMLLAVLLHTPLLDPLRLSAAHQYYRLMNGQADPKTFDYAALRYHLGHAGEARLQHMQHASVPFQATLDDQLKLLAKTESYYDFRNVQKKPLVPEQITVLPAGQPLPEALWQVMRTHDRLEETHCVAPQGCIAYAINLDTDAPLECVLLTPGAGNYNLLELYDQNAAGEWVFIQSLYPDDGNAADITEAVLAAMQKGEVSAQTPRYYQDLVIGGHRFYAERRQ